MTRQRARHHPAGLGPDLRQRLADIKTLAPRPQPTGAARPRKPWAVRLGPPAGRLRTTHRSAAGLPASYDTFWLIAEKRP